MDIALMRLQYEILNTSVNYLADASGISADMIEEEINRAGWKQLWPNEPSLSNPESLHKSITSAAASAAASASSNQVDIDEDEFTTVSATIIDRARRRLQIYSLAKETYLSSRYLDLEASLLDVTLSKILELSSAAQGGYSANDLKQLSSVYKDLTNGSALSAAASLQFGTDESGIPTVIFKDLSGK